MYFAFLRAFLHALIACVVFFWTSAATAQNIDPNIQSRIESFIPKPDEREIKPAVTLVPVTETRTVVRDVVVPLNREQRLIKLDEAMRAAGAPALQTLTVLKSAALERQFRKFGVPKVEVKRLEVVETQTKIVEQPLPVFQFSGSGGYTFDTNANRSKNDRRSDSIASANALFYSQIGLNKVDTLGLTAVANSLRYRQINSRDSDSFGTTVAYTKLIGSMPEAGPKGLRTTDKIGFAFDTLSSLQPFYTAIRTINFYTPSLTWSHGNVPWGGETCGKGDNEKYCRSVDFKAVAKYSFSDISTLENTNLRLETAVNWLTKTPGLTIIATGGVTGAHYTNTAIKRDDLGVDLAAKVQWYREYAKSVAMTLTGSVKFTQQWSALATAEWNGFSISPNLKLTLTALDPRDLEKK